MISILSFFIGFRPEELEGLEPSTIKTLNQGLSIFRIIIIIMQDWPLRGKNDLEISDVFTKNKPRLISAANFFRSKIV